MAFALLLAGGMFAIDPLPTRLEHAPLEVQRQYLDREAQASIKLKQKVGQQRYDQRKQLKASIISSLRAEVADQHALLVDPTSGTPVQNFEVLVPKSIFAGREEDVWLGLVGVLMTVLVSRTLARHRQEAEIRRLCGGYLSDGTEVASYKLPEWFSPAPPLVQSATELFVEKNPSSLELTRPGPVAEFFALAPERLEQIRNVLRELGVSGPLDERQKTLWKAHELICGLKDKANCWDLRPAWQMSSAIELLLKRVADKPKDTTASVIRTIAAAVDVLHEVCGPGVRANLLIDPPLKILAVDDDPLCRRALQFALEKAHFTTDLAENGEKAVELAAAHAYDVVFMDIQMPGINGLTACEQIHETKKNADVPVVFVTVQSDFNTRAQLRLKGGADLMAKPFLIFELTVRAVTFAMRKRLQTSGSSRREMVVMKPALPQPILAASPEPTVAVPSVSAEAAAPAAPVEAFPISVVELNGDFFSEAPAYLATTRQMIDELRAAAARGIAPESMGALYFRVHAIAAGAGRARLPIAAHVSSTLEALLKRLYLNPKIVTASTLNTVSNALKQMEMLCVPGTEEKLADHPPVRILVVDDEPLARRAVVGALQLAFEKPDSAQDGAKAAALAAQESYDVIFTDVQMPAMNGFELCLAIRGGGPNVGTPVVFITSHTDVGAQAQATASGGNDFIGKPFLPIEITVKALTFAWESRLRKIASAASASPPLKQVQAPQKQTEPAEVLVAR